MLNGDCGRIFTARITLLRCRAGGKQLSFKEMFSFPVLVVFGCF